MILRLPITVFCPVGVAEFEVSNDVNVLFPELTFGVGFLSVNKLILNITFVLTNCTFLFEWMYLGKTRERAFAGVPLSARAAVVPFCP